jgi:hypothetical protein
MDLNCFGAIYHQDLFGHHETGIRESLLDIFKLIMSISMFIQDPTHFGQTGLQHIHEQPNNHKSFSNSETVKTIITIVDELETMWSLGAR